MKGNSFYFSHDYNAANDTKVLFLRHQLGMEGYGIYWFLIERLADAGGKLPIELIPVLAMQMQSTDVKVKGVITQFDLFKIDKGEFWSERLHEHLQLRQKLSESGKNGAANRWANGGAIGEANAKERKVKEIKGKENKVKEKKVNEITFPFDSDVFKKYWSLWLEFKKEQFNFTYKSKISIQATLNELVKLSNGQEQTAIKIIEQSIAKGWQGFFQIKNENNGNTSYTKQAPKVTIEQLNEAFTKRRNGW
jgi:uncharacterized protein YdaU (DUF1376 family)